MSRLQGCDVSHWNGRPDWAAAARAGLKWAAVKLSQGANITDAQAARNVDQLRDLALPIMPYHFLYPGVPAADQFARFHAAVEACGGWEGMIVPALDVEGDEHCALRGMSSAAYCHLAGDWLVLLLREIGRPGVVYTYPSFNTEHGVGARLGGQSLLWAASYGAKAPHFAGWEQTTFWQTSDHGSWPGIGGGLDMDWFLGTEAELRALLVQAKPKPLVVGADGQPVNCKPEWVGDSVTVAAMPLLRALGLPLTPLPPVVHTHSGRAFIRELEPYCRPWGFFYRDTPQGPRVYCKRVVAA